MSKHVTVDIVREREREREPYFSKIINNKERNSNKIKEIKLKDSS